ADLRDLEADLAAGVEPGPDEVLDDLVLSVDGDRLAAGQLAQRDPMGLPFEAEVDAVMDEALTPQPVADARLVQQIDRALLEHACPDRRFDLLAAAALEHD